MILESLKNHDYEKLAHFSDAKLITEFKNLIQDDFYNLVFIGQYIDEQKKYYLIDDLIFLNNVMAKIYKIASNHEDLVALLYLVKTNILQGKIAMQPNNEQMGVWLNELRYFKDQLSTCYYNGISTLVKQHHEYTLTHLKTILDDRFFKLIYWDSDIINSLCRNGFFKEVEENLANISTHLLLIAFQDEKIKNRLLTKELIIERDDVVAFFSNLTHKEYLGYLFNKEFNDRRNSKIYLAAEKRPLLENLYQNNFSGILTKKLQLKLIDLYGEVSASTIEFAILKTLGLKEEFWTLVEKYNQEFFEDEYQCLTFWATYPNLMNQLNMSDKERIKYVIDYILKAGAALNIESFDDDLTTLHHVFLKKEDAYRPLNISLTGYENMTVFNYNRELVVLSREGTWTSIYCEHSHYNRLEEYYKASDFQNMDSVYYGNSLGDVIIVVEGETVVVWLPSNLSEIQKEILQNVELKSSLNDLTKVKFGCAIILPEENEYYCFYNGETMNIETFKKIILHCPVIKEQSLNRKRQL